MLLWRDTTLTLFNRLDCSCPFICWRKFLEEKKKTHTTGLGEDFLNQKGDGSPGVLHLQAEEIEAKKEFSRRVLRLIFFAIFHLLFWLNFFLLSSLFYFLFFFLTVTSVRVDFYLNPLRPQIRCKTNGEKRK